MTITCFQCIKLTNPTDHRIQYKRGDRAQSFILIQLYTYTVKHLKLV